MEETLCACYHYLVETNKLGKRRVQVNLTGITQEASGHLYVSWLLTKYSQCKRTAISHDMLCDLWQVSVPTQSALGKIAGIGKQPNFAQSNNMSPINVPAQAYLTLNRDG